MNLDVEPMSGEDLQALVAKVYDTPPQVVERVRAATSGQ